MSDYKERARKWLADNGYTPRDETELAAEFEAVAKEAVNEHFRLQHQAWIANIGRDRRWPPSEQPPKPQWKPGQMLISDYEESLYRLDREAHGVDEGSWHTSMWDWESRKWELSGVWGNFDGYEPYPRVGDWVSCREHGVFRVVKVQDSIAGYLIVHDKDGGWHPATDLEPASPPVELPPQRELTPEEAKDLREFHKKIYKPIEQPKPITLEGPHWELGNPLFLDDNAYGEAIKRDLDLRDAVRDLQKVHNLAAK